MIECTQLSLSLDADTRTLDDVSRRRQLPISQRLATHSGRIYAKFKCVYCYRYLNCQPPTAASVAGLPRMRHVGRLSSGAHLHCMLS